VRVSEDRSAYFFGACQCDGDPLAGQPCSGCKKRNRECRLDETMKSRRASRGTAEVPSTLNYLRNCPPAVAPHPGLSSFGNADTPMSSETSLSGSLADPRQNHHTSVSGVHSRSNASLSPSRNALSLRDLGRLTIDEEYVHSVDIRYEMPIDRSSSVDGGLTSYPLLPLRRIRQARRTTSCQIP
jgi:hypothetical protein